MKGFQKKKNLCCICRYGKWHFKPKISSVFHFVLVNDGWSSHILCVKWFFINHFTLLHWTALQDWGIGTLYSFRTHAFLARWRIISSFGDPTKAKTLSSSNRKLDEKSVVQYPVLLWDWNNNSNHLELIFTRTEVHLHHKGNVLPSNSKIF